MHIQGDRNSRRIECALNNFTPHFASTFSSCKNPSVSREKHDSHVQCSNGQPDVGFVVLCFSMAPVHEDEDECTTKERTISTDSGSANEKV